jgi:hypothetical protein
MKHYLPLLTILGLLVALSATTAAATAASSHKRPTKSPAHPSLRSNPFEFEEEDETEGEEEFAGEEEFEFEECLGAQEEFEDLDEEEGEEEEFEAACETELAKGAPDGAPFVTAPMVCMVRRAESTITAIPATNQVRLTVRYKTYAPTRVTVALKLKDKKGVVRIEHKVTHLGEKGVLHITTKLGSAVMARALKATEFDVGLQAPETPAICAADLEQRLHSVKHTSAKAPRVYSNR